VFFFCGYKTHKRRFQVSHTIVSLRVCCLLCSVLTPCRNAPAPCVEGSDDQSVKRTRNLLQERTVNSDALLGFRCAQLNLPTGVFPPASMDDDDMPGKSSNVSQTTTARRRSLSSPLDYFSGVVTTLYTVAWTLGSKQERRRIVEQPRRT
jgi:hypothetical protein